MVALILALWLAPVNVPMTTIARGEMSAIDEPREVVVRDAAAWSKLWKEHNWNDPAPAVDFTRRMVIGVFLGTRQTAGYTVEVTGVTEDAGSLAVRYTERRPATRDVTAQILTMPFHLVSVAAHTGPVRFVRTEAERD
jgi:protease stability complex PrcB-like protein